MSICLTSDRAVASMHDKWLDAVPEDTNERVEICQKCGDEIHAGEECYKWDEDEYYCYDCIRKMRMYLE